MPCKIFDGSCSAHRCGLEHKHCAKCGLVAFPSAENSMRLEYLAFEDPNTRVREFEPVPDACPLPAHLRPYRAKRRRQLPFKTGRRWSLFQAFDSYKRADAWFVEASLALGAEAWGPPQALLDYFGDSSPSVAALKRLGRAWCVFVRVDRKYLPALERRIWRNVQAT